MKQKIYLVGLLAVVLVSLGITFKLNHFPGAGVLLTLGLVCLNLIFLPLALVNNYRSEGNKKNLVLYIITFLTCLVVFGSMLFKLMHWPYAGILLTIALPFPFVVFLPVYLSVTSRIKNFSIYNTVMILVLLTMISLMNALLSLGITRNSIVTSQELAGKYNRMEVALNPELLTAARQTGIAELHSKQEELLAIVEQCRESMLLKANIPVVVWNGSLSEPVPNIDSRDSPAEVMLFNGEECMAAKLESAIMGYLSALEGVPGGEHFASTLTGLFEMKPDQVEDYIWRYLVFQNRHLAWTLIWFEEIEVTLKITEIALHKYLIG
jgi:hypothetical protein